jgi:fumarylacetoacetate (FAA) hydrolase family protein
MVLQVGRRVSGPQQQLGIREDSTVDVPEPELALVINRFGEVVGYTICNDMSSRSIEGEMRGDIHPDGAVLSTGTCLVPPPPFTRADGDVVSIAIEGIGTLRNPRVRGHVRA